MTEPFNLALKVLPEQAALAIHQKARELSATFVGDLCDASDELEAEHGFAASITLMNTTLLEMVSDVVSTTVARLAPEDEHVDEIYDRMMGIALEALRTGAAVVRKRDLHNVRTTIAMGEADAQEQVH